MGIDKNSGTYRTILLMTILMTLVLGGMALISIWAPEILVFGDFLKVAISFGVIVVLVLIIGLLGNSVKDANASGDDNTSV